MKIFHILFSFLFLLSFSSLAQHDHGLKPCGTQSYKSPWLKKYQKSPQSYIQRKDEILEVPISINIVGTDEGSGFGSESLIYRAIQKLNADFESSEIKFYIRGGFNYISNSDWVSHNDVEIGAEMMFANNLDHTINCYIVTDPAGNCGYNLPYAGIALAANCIREGDDTWAHEVGHNLSIQHPFLGWEGGIYYNGNGSYTYDQPAPEYVTYDYTVFKSVQYSAADTLIIDTAWVEKVDGSNCSFAGDGFCDTAPDYFTGGQPCDPNTGLSAAQLTDPDGVKFNSDASLIMAYWGDECGQRFTPMQSAAMRANLIDEKPDHLLNNVPPPTITAESLELNYPVGGELTGLGTVTLEWEAVEHAEYYLVEIARTSSLASVRFDTFTKETSASFDDLRADKTYYWRVVPFTSHQFDREGSEIESFITSELVSNNDIAIEKPFLINTNSLFDGQNLNIDFNEPNQKSIIDIIGINGQSAISRSNYRDDVSINLDFAPKGIYFVNIESNGKNWVEKIIKL